MAEKNGKKVDVKKDAKGDVKETKAKEETKKLEPVKAGQVSVYSKAEGKNYKIKATSLDKFIKTGQYTEV